MYVYQVSSNRATFAEAETNCLPHSSWPHRSQLFFSTQPRDLDYILSLVDDAYTGESFWVGIDDRDDDAQWITSLNRPYPKNSTFFSDGDAGSKPCGYVKSGSAGFVTSSDCSLKHYYVCETQQLDQAPDYPCPRDYVPYKDECFMPNPQRKTYDSAQIYCATRGGIVLPIRDKGTFEFIKAWGPRAIRNDVWMGLRKKNYTRLYDANSDPPLHQIITDELTYSDGQGFNIDNDYKLEAKILRGECFSLKSSENMELRDYKCNREIGFICQWTKINCPNETEYEYSYLGQISSGRNCYGVGGEASFMDGTCNSENDLLRERWTPKDPNEIDLYRRSYGYETLSNYIT